MQPIEFTLNGRRQTVHASAITRLLDVIREECGLTGTKEGCGEGECGACSVFVDGKLVNSCLIPILQVQGAQITTIEGLSKDEDLHPVQQAFLECGGAQCGICTPGMILASENLRRRTSNPTDAEIQEALGGNLCRCTGYMKIFDSVKKACQR